MGSLGFEVFEAEHGADGLDLLEKNADSIGVVLVDWNMPVMNGLEFVEVVRDREEFSDHKVVMVTTETEPTRMARALMAGVDEFVMKPFTSEILIEKLQLIGVEMNSASA